MRELRTYLSHYTGNAILRLCENFLHADDPRARIAHICLYESGISIASAILVVVLHDGIWDIGFEENVKKLPWIDDQSHQLRVLIVDLSEDPMLNGLADSIRCGGDRALVHTANTAQ